VVCGLVVMVSTPSGVPPPLPAPAIVPTNVVLSSRLNPRAPSFNLPLTKAPPGTQGPPPAPHVHPNQNMTNSAPGFQPNQYSQQGPMKNMPPMNQYGRTMGSGVGPNMGSSSQSRPTNSQQHQSNYGGGATGLGSGWGGNNFGSMDSGGLLDFQGLAALANAAGQGGIDSQTQNYLSGYENVGQQPNPNDNQSKKINTI